MSSILDRVLLSHEMNERQQLNPVDVCAQLLKLLSSREADVLRLRYGLDGELSRTLESIGRQYSITRERVRQIEHQSIERIRAAKQFGVISEGITTLVHHSLMSHGNVRRQDVLMSDLLSLSGDNPMNRSSLSFVIEQLLTHLVEEIDDEERHPSWKIKDASIELFHKVVTGAKEILTSHGQPLGFDEFLIRFSSHPVMVAHKEEFRTFSSFGASSEQEDIAAIERVVLSYIECSRHLRQDPFGEWGLSTWQSVAPRRMSDKIYLVLKKYGNPLHFTAITEHINKTKFDHKIAHAPTVHNELILDVRFVLVGRGTYALHEWGYEPGVVADVITNIMKRVGTSMTREQIIQEVGKQRIVKKGTILLALTDRDRFTRNDDGTYSLVNLLPSTSS